MRRWFLLGAWAVAACSSATVPGTPSGPAPAPAGAGAPKPGAPASGLEVARLGPGDLRFQISRHDSLNLQYPTGSQLQVLDRTGRLLGLESRFVQVHVMHDQANVLIVGRLVTAALTPCARAWP